MIGFYNQELKSFTEGGGKFVGVYDDDVPGWGLAIDRYSDGGYLDSQVQDDESPGSDLANPVHRSCLYILYWVDNNNNLALKARPTSVPLFAVA